MLSIFRAPRLPGAVLLLMGLAGCQAVSEYTPPTEVDEDVLNALPINSFNYTDRTISRFTVNGVDGGNVLVSRPTAGGGGGVCCMRWSPHLQFPRRYTVRWITDMCKYPVHVGGGDFFNFRDLWAEQVATMQGPVPNRPEAFEVHFYPDGHVEVAFAAVSTTIPRLQLPFDKKTGRRPGVPDWPHCTPEQMQTYVE
jgi:uncharacterized protein DUF3304